MTKFNELIFICDNEMHWVAMQMDRLTAHLKQPIQRVSSETSLRSLWSRANKAPKIILHWECEKRLGGTIVEELLEIDPRFDVEERLIVLSSDPHPEDRIYFAELGLTNVIYMSNKGAPMKKAMTQLKTRLLDPSGLSAKREKLWRKIICSIEQIRPTTDSKLVAKLRLQVDKAGDIDGRDTARFYYAKGLLALQLGHEYDAEDIWQGCLRIDTHYYPARQKLIELDCIRGDYQKALESLKTLQRRNKNNVSRLVKIGELHHKLADLQKGEHYFNAALAKDENCSPALNGLAALRFEQGRLEESRTLLARSKMAAKMASTLNQQGIHLVQNKAYEEALSHYSKAQYVLPQQDKSPMLFYNMGLCYSRWGKGSVAKQYLQIALIKEPGYTKARKLLEQIEAA